MIKEIIDTVKKELKKSKHKNKEKELQSLADINHFEQIIQRRRSDMVTISMLLFPISMWFALTLFGLTLLFMFQIDIMLPLKLIISSLFKLWLPLILIGVLIDLIEYQQSKKVRARLLERFGK